MLLLVAVACADDYDDTALWDKVNDHEERIAALEKWQEQTNRSIAGIQELLNTTDFITSVTTLTEDGQTVGYTISFQQADPITIYNGEKGNTGEDGQTPLIDLTQKDDGNWYWTLNGELMTDADGNSIRANGEDGKDGQDGADGEDGKDGADGEDGADGSTGPAGRPGADGKPAPTPQILLGNNITNGTIKTDNGAKDAEAWYLSVDNGVTWYRVSGKDGADGSTGTPGDSWFSEAPKKEGNYYVFTLTTGSSFKVAAYQAFRILTEAEKNGSATFDNTTVPVNGATTLYLSIDEGIEYSSIVAQVTPVDAVLTRADASWSAKVAKDEATGSVTVTVTPPAQMGCALLDVSLLLTDGSKLTASRLLAYGYSYDNSTNTYTVYTADGLLAWNEAARNNLSTNCTLAADITLPTVADGESNWTPIGDSSNGYTGIFEGNGHTITGMTVTGSDEYIGLFGIIYSDSSVRNLKLNNVQIKGTSSSTGGVAGVNYGDITNCSVSGNVESSAPVGGLVGQNDGTVTACYATGLVKGSGSVGGLVGQNTRGTVTACYATSRVEGAQRVGGVVGFNSYAIVTACYHAGGTVVSSDMSVGGVTGVNNVGNLTACYWENNQEQGIGDIWEGGTIIEASKVDGTTVTWQTAVEQMNAALQSAGSEWRYELSGALPTLKKE